MQIDPALSNKIVFARSDGTEFEHQVKEFTAEEINAAVQDARFNSGAADIEIISLPPAFEIT